MDTEYAAQIGGERKIAGQLGFYSSLFAFFAAAGYCIAQLLQVFKVVRFPVDAYLIYGFSLGIAAPYLVAVVALHYLLPPWRHLWSQLGVVFAVMYVTYVNLNYVVQLTTVVPAALHGSLNEIRVLDQTPHSLFWDIDALGYICMGISTFFLVFAFTHEQKWLRRFLFANGMMVPVISFVYFYRDFSTTILFIGLPWIITAPGSLLLLATFFWSDVKDNRLLPKVA
jgi:hypothetical protein